MATAEVDSTEIGTIPFPLFFGVPGWARTVIDLEEDLAAAVASAAADLEDLVVVVLAAAVPAEVGR